MGRRLERKRSLVILRPHFAPPDMPATARALARVDRPLQLPTEAPTDSHLVTMWLHGRPATTQRAYRADAGRFFEFIAKPLQHVALQDLQAFADALEDASYSPNTRARALAAVKSLITFGHKLGYLTFDVGRPVKLPPRKNTLGERILEEADLQLLLRAEKDPRNHALLRLGYVSGLRCSEIANLCWRDCVARGDAGQVTVFGKGAKTRVVLLNAGAWRELQQLRPQSARPGDPVFVSRRGGRLDPATIWRIVRAAAERAQLEAKVSPHWLRHAHATHALERGAPIQLVQQTLGHTSIETTGKYLHARPSDSSARYLADR